MTQNRALIAVPAFVVLVIAAVILVVTSQNRSSAPPPEGGRRSDTSHGPSVRAPRPDSDEEDGFGENEGQPEPNVTGVVVDEEGRPVEGALVTARHLVPYLTTEMSRKAMREGYDFGPEPESENDASPWGMFPECRTGKDGRFALHACDELWYELTIKKEGLRSPARVFREPQEGIRLVLYGRDSLDSIVLRVGDADTGEPITRFTVTSGWLSREPWGEDTKILRTAVHDENGELRLEEVGGYVLSGMSVHAEGYVPYGAWGSDGRTRVAVRLCKTAELTGKVVWASSGDPVAGVVIEIDGRTPETREACSFRADYTPYSTDADGAFSISPVPAGRVVVSAYEAPQGTFGGWANDRSMLVEKDLVLPPGQTTSVVLKIPGAPRGASGYLSGRLVDRETGDPVGGIQVSLASDVPSSGGDFGGDAESSTETLTTKSDTNGAFSFDEVPLHNYGLRVVDDTYVLAGNDWFRLEPGERIEGAVFKLARSGRVEGRVTHPSGAPAQAKVSCSLADAFGGGTDEEGYYSFNRVVPGRALISCTEMTDYVDLGDRFVDIRPGETTRVDFVVPETYTLSGKVTVAGATIEDSEYRLLSRLADTDQAVGFVEMHGWEEHGGRFVFEDVPPGKYTVYATMKTRDSLSELVASVPVDVVAADVEVELELPCICISGRVLDAASGQPIPGIAVTIWREQPFGDPPAGGVDVQPAEAVSVFTDQDSGTYTIGALGNGRYAITVSDDEHGAGHAEIDIVDGKLIGDPDIWLKPACEVRCSVGSTQPDAELGFVLVTVRDITDTLVTRTWIKPSMFRSLSEHDEFVVGYLASGHYVLEAVSVFAAWQRVELEVTENGKNLVEFRLPTGKTLVIEATDLAGKPVPGAIPDIKDTSGRSRMRYLGHFESDREVSLHGASDGQGITRIEHLLPGSYTLTVQAAGCRTTEQQVEVLDAEETGVKVVLERVREE